jgi:hypothetical protein
MRDCFCRCGCRIHFALRPERFAEGVGEIVTLLKIVARIFIRFRKQADFHHVENEFAEIAAVFDAPFFEHRFGHRAELHERELPDAVEQFLAGHMADFAVVFLADDFLREVERLAEKNVGVPRVTRILREDLLHGFVEIDFLHFKVWLVAPPALVNARRDKFLPPSRSVIIPQRSRELIVPVSSSNSYPQDNVKSLEGKYPPARTIPSSLNFILQFDVQFFDFPYSGH